MESVIYKVLSKESLNTDTTFLSAEDCYTLLKEDVDQELSCHDDALKAYPKYPLYKRIAGVFEECIKTGECSSLNLPHYALLDESEYTQQRADKMAEMMASLQGGVSLWDDWTDSEKEYNIKKILKNLGKRGIMDLLGMRKTVGSVEVFPLPKSSLIKSFNLQNKPSSMLTVGAKALTKHCHRDETSSWWGHVSGSEEVKNTYGNTVLHRILNDASWINIHCLPGELAVIEVRTSEGYGARWTSDGNSFRGFLEPQMKDGHQVGWRH